MKKKLTVSGFTIYLAVLLLLVVLYVIIFVPMFSTQANQMNGQKSLMQSEITALQTYEGQMNIIQKQINDAETVYDNDTRLMLPVKFADELYSAAAKTDCLVADLSISEGGVTEADPNLSVYTADILLAVLRGSSPTTFIQQIEGIKGAGFFVTSMTYTPMVRTVEQGKATNAPIAADGHGANSADEQAAAAQAIIARQQQEEAQRAAEEAKKKKEEEESAKKILEELVGAQPTQSAATAVRLAPRSFTFAPFVATGALYDEEMLTGLNVDNYDFVSITIQLVTMEK